MVFIGRQVEEIINPLQQSDLNKKGLCDYVINVATGCRHGCLFCYVPSTPVVRMRQDYLKERGIDDPQMEWGKYLLVRKDIPEKLEKILSKKKKWHKTPAGRGIVLLCSGTDPYQNKETATIATESVKVLLKYGKRVRILTRSPLWLNDIEVLNHPDVIIGMSLPHLDDELSRQIEPRAPLPSDRYRALEKGRDAGCRIYVAMAPTPPQMSFNEFRTHLEKLAALDPETIFWEPINARGTNGRRMIAAGLEFVDSIATQKAWAKYFLEQWEQVELAAIDAGCLDKLHVWADPQLKNFTEAQKLNQWFFRAPPESWRQSYG